jgi:hypothetical protein
MTTRDWTMHKRAGWWGKHLATVMTFILTLAAILKLFGVSIDLQTKTEAQVQHAAIKKELHDEIERVTRRIEKKVDAMTMALITHNKTEIKNDEIKPEKGP